MRGIVILAGKVKYKFDTGEDPAIEAGETIVHRNDVKDILSGADYNTADNTYTNPPSAVVDYKALYAAAATDSEKIAVLAKERGLIP